MQYRWKGYNIMIYKKRKFNQLNDNRKITVAHIVQSPGGVERYLHSLLKYLNHDKIDNILICSHDYVGENYINLVGTFENVDMIRAISPSYDIKALIQIRKLLKKYQPDIVYCHSSKAGVLGRIANLGMKNKCIYNAHGWAFKMLTKKSQIFIFSTIEKILAPFCNKIICISAAEKKSAIEKHICSNDKACIIYNGIDFDECEKDNAVVYKEELNIPSNAYVIGYVGRLSSQKAPDIYVKAAKIIKEKIPTAFFLMVGDGEDREKVEKQIKDYDLIDSVKITGWVTNPMSYIKLFDVATLVSRWEGFGLVLPEYMLAGKPIVATKIDAIPNIVTDRLNGTLVDMDDYNAVARGVIELFENADLCKAYVTAGKEIVRDRFNAERMAREHENLFEHLIKN